MLNLVWYVSLCEGLRARAGSLSYIVHIDCCGLSTIVIKKIIIIIMCIHVWFHNRHFIVLREFTYNIKPFLDGESNVIGGQVGHCTDTNVVRCTGRSHLDNYLLLKSGHFRLGHLQNATSAVILWKAASLDREKDTDDSARQHILVMLFRKSVSSSCRYDSFHAAKFDYSDAYELIKNKFWYQLTQTVLKQRT